MSDLGTTRDVLLLDGDCGLCHRLATFVDRRLRSDVDLAYRPILSADGEALIATFPEQLQALDTVYLVRNGVVHTVAKHRHRFFAQPEVCMFRID